MIIILCIGRIYACQVDENSLKKQQLSFCMLKLEKAQKSLETTYKKLDEQIFFTADQDIYKLQRLKNIVTKNFWHLGNMLKSDDVLQEMRRNNHRVLNLLIASFETIEKSKKTLKYARIILMPYQSI